MKALLLSIKKRLYVYVAVDLAVALLVGSIFNVHRINLRIISLIAVFIMLYPMLTGMAIEKVEKAGRNYKLIALTLFFAFFIASGTAFVLSRTIFENNTALIMLLLTNVNFNIKVAACSLVSNYEIAKKRRMWNPYIKAISRHNGGWFNYRYVNHVTRIRKRIKNELKNTTKS